MSTTTTAPRSVSGTCTICLDPPEEPSKLHTYQGCCSPQCHARFRAQEAYLRHTPFRPDWPQIPLSYLELIYLAEVDASYEEQASAVLWEFASRLRAHNDPLLQCALAEGETELLEEEEEEW